MVALNTQTNHVNYHILGKTLYSSPLMQNAKLSIMRTFKRVVMGLKLWGEKGNHYRKYGATSQRTRGVQHFHNNKNQLCTSIENEIKPHKNHAKRVD